MHDHLITNYLSKTQKQQYWDEGFLFPSPQFRVNNLKLGERRLKLLNRLVGQ